LLKNAGNVFQVLFEPCFHDYLCWEKGTLSTRVTGLGEFSPNEWLFSLGRFFENYRNSPHCGHFFRSKSSVLILSENGLGTMLGEFFTNLSGHPAQCPLHSCWFQSGQIANNDIIAFLFASVKKGQSEIQIDWS
jgi:hypothetical protein